MLPERSHERALNPVPHLYSFIKGRTKHPTTIRAEGNLRDALERTLMLVNDQNYPDTRYLQTLSVLTLLKKAERF
jgi:hypothetical protein